MRNFSLPVVVVVLIDIGVFNQSVIIMANIVPVISIPIIIP